MDRDQALRIVDSLYAAALGEADWPAALALLADVLGGSAATLEIQNVTRNKLSYFSSAGIAPEAMRVYLRDFAATNSRARFMSRSPRRIGFDQLFITEPEMDRDPFYMDFLRPADLRYFMAAQTPLIDQWHRGVLTVQRSGRRRGLDEEHLESLHRLLPHVDRSIALFWRRMRHQLDPEHLDRQLATYGLTPAERRLAVALALGEAPPQYGRRNRLSMNTVYAHYRHVKEKLDTPRQPDLLARLRSL